MPWATTTVSHALLGNFEVTVPFCRGEVGPGTPHRASNECERLHLMGALVRGAGLIVPKRPGVQLPPTSSTAQPANPWVEPAEIGAVRLSQGTFTASPC